MKPANLYNLYKVSHIFRQQVEDDLFWRMVDRGPFDIILRQVRGQLRDRALVPMVERLVL